MSALFRLRGPPNLAGRAAIMLVLAIGDSGAMSRGFGIVLLAYALFAIAHLVSVAGSHFEQLGKDFLCLLEPWP